MKRIRLFLLMLFVGISTSFAQRQVSGVVTDANDGQPIAGASVVVKGTHVGVATNASGEYTITIPSGHDVLVVSYIGYKQQDVAAAGSVVNVRMDVDMVGVENVVVTAYGTTTKKAFTGTASVVKADEIEALQVSSVSQTLQGLASGVMVLNTTGQPGANAEVRIRGIGSLAGSNEPLYVVDGVAFAGNVNTINPQDIESMTVLKDANSTALYGSRAANGVIMITTKQGRVGKPKVQVDVTAGLTTRARTNYTVVGAEDYLKLAWEGNRNSLYDAAIAKGKPITMAEAATLSTSTLMGNYKGYNPYNVANPVGTDGNIVAGAQLYYDEDWQKAFRRTGKRQDYKIQVSGGSENTRYLFSGGYLRDQGLYKGSDFNRFNIRAKVDSKVLNWLTIGLNTNIAYTQEGNPRQADAYTRNPVSQSLVMPNIFPVYQRNKENTDYLKDKDGNMIYDFGINQSPTGGERLWASRYNYLGSVELDEIKADNMNINNIAYAEAKFLRHFTFRSQMGVNWSAQANKEFYNPKYGDGMSYDGLSTRENMNYSDVTWQNTLTYDQTFNDKHHVNVLAGTDAYSYYYNYNYSQKAGFSGLMDGEPDYGLIPQSVGGNKTSTRNMRYLARAAYDFDNRYHFSANYTYDGTSRFAQPVRWGSFWSVGAAWNIANEQFFAGINDWWNVLKLRASYGTSGNQNVGYFPYKSYYVGGYDVGDNAGAVLSTLQANSLTWEKQGQLDVGIDFAFLNGAISGSVTYYDRRSKDLLMSRPMAPSTGIPSITDNIGKMKNSGVEIDLSAVIFNKENFRWTAGFNISSNKNKVLSLPESVKDGMSASNNKFMEVGKSAYEWYMPEWAGVDPKNGDALWYTTNAQGERVTTNKYSNANFVTAGDMLPKWFGGFNTNIQWKGFDFGAIISYSIGGKIYDDTKPWLMDRAQSVRGRQFSTDVLTRWQKEGDITNVPRLGNSAAYHAEVSTINLVNADYLRLRNITLGYNFANLLGVKNFGLTNLRLYFSADNLITIFGTQGLDPEVGMTGTSNLNTAPLRTISFGLNVGF